jgi:DnaA family protein
MPQQLPLPLGLNQELSFAQFWPGPNREAVEQLRQIALGQGEALILIWGDPGNGKSHLLNACCSGAADHGYSAAYFPMRLLHEHGPAVLDGAETYPIICIDDIDAMAGQPDWELGLFNLFNRLREAGHRLVISASLPPAQMNVNLPDLTSRLAWGLTLRLQHPDEEDTRHILQMKSRSLGLEMPDAVARFLMNHAQRDLPTLTALLDQLDRASLVAQRRLTIPFVKELIGL